MFTASALVRCRNSKVCRSVDTGCCKGLAADRGVFIRDADVGNVLVPLRAVHIMTGTGQRVPVRSILRNLDNTGFRVADKGVAVDNKVNAVLVVRVIGDQAVSAVCIRTHVELNVAAGHAEGNAGRDIARASAVRRDELRLLASGIDVGVVGEDRAPAEAVVASELTDGQVTADRLRNGTGRSSGRFRRREVHRYRFIKNDLRVAGLRLDGVEALFIDSRFVTDRRRAVVGIGHEVDVRASEAAERAADIEREDAGIEARACSRTSVL